MSHSAVVCAPFLKRPPTPPRESSAKLLDESILLNNAIDGRLLDTPDESPSSSAELSKDTLERAGKKVGFSGWTKYHKPPDARSKGYDSDDLRPLPPSRDCKSTKSILKCPASNASTETSNDHRAWDNSSFPAMLRSASLHLASDDRASRLDAYSTLVACLSTYEDLPDPQALVNKIPEFTGYIRRDVAASMGEDNSPDTQLITQALKLLTTFLLPPKTATALPEDFCIAITERSLSSIESDSSPKIVVCSYMHLLERQRFPLKIMTQDRVIRILRALDGVTARTKGNRVICHRLMIYQRLLTQARSIMISHVGCWINNLIAAMLSTIKDLRARAIAFGVEAGSHLGTVSSISQACIDVFNRESSEGKKVVEILTARLLEMTSSKDDAIHVPQIWSVIVILLRGNRHQIERWDHFKAWLVVIQRCFNASDVQVKYQAMIAWDHLVFAVNIEPLTSPSMAKMLKQPIASQLERKSSEKTWKLGKQVARSSYCTLLYYSLRPSASYAQLDQYWELYVEEMLPRCFAASQVDIHHACNILAALLSSSGPPKAWDEKKAIARGPVNADDLPCLDPKWCRSRAAKILRIFDKLFDAAGWQPDGVHEAPIVLAWRSFVSALGLASSKEIKVSIESMTAMAHIMNQIQQLLLRPKSEAHSTQQVYMKIDCMIGEAVGKLGSIPFLENRLILTHTQAYEAATETPSNRPKIEPKLQTSPATHLLRLLLSVQRGHGSIEYANAIKSVVALNIQSLSSRRSQIGTLRDLARLLSAEDSVVALPARCVLWQSLAEASVSTLKLPSASDNTSASPVYLGHEYRDVIKILEVGLQQHSSSLISTWQQLFERINQVIEKEFGAAGVALLVTEPLAGSICQEIANKCDEFVTKTAVTVFASVLWPQSQQQLEKVRTQLWGMKQFPHKLTPFEPFDRLYTMLNAVLDTIYSYPEQFSSETMISVLTSVDRLLKSCTPSLRTSCLSRIQQGLATWLEDSKGRMASTVNGAYFKVREIQTMIMTIITDAAVFDSQLLKTFQVLLVCAMRSRHRAILNDFVTTWNCTFGKTDSLEYPEKLRCVLLDLRSVTDIDLPNLPESIGQEHMPLFFDFIDIEESGNKPQHSTEIHQSPQLPFERLLSRLGTPTKHLAERASPKSIGTRKSPFKSGRKSVQATPRARLRHDDSQILFAAIEPQPLAPKIAESQLLTDRQKEVRERQGFEAAMFPQISSSPPSVSKPTKFALRKMTANLEGPSATSVGLENESSPIFPPDDMMNDFLGSSPTPSSSKKRSDGIYSDDNAQSSPPFTHPHLPIYKSYARPIEGCGAPPDLGKACEKEDDVGKPFNDLSSKEAPDDLKNVGEVQSLKVPGTRQNVLESRQMSDLDVYVDAPSEPEGIQALNRNENRAIASDSITAASSKNVIGSENQSMPPSNSSRRISGHAAPSPNNNLSESLDQAQKAGSSQYSTAEDQVTAQLMNEMERAQQNRVEPAFGSSPMHGSEKRKRESTTEPRKRAKTTSLAPSATEVAADCVLIEARPAIRTVAALLPEVQIKRERSLSPPMNSVRHAVHEMPVIDKRPPRRQRVSITSQTSSQDEASVRRSARKVRLKSGHDKKQISEPKKKIPVAERYYYVPSSPLKSVVSPEQDTEQDTPLITTGKGREPIGPSSMEDGPTDEPWRDDRPEHLTPEPSAVAADQGSQHVTSADKRPNAQGILQSFRQLYQDLKQVTFRPEEERAMVSVLFKAVQQTHEAGRRHNASG